MHLIYAKLFCGKYDRELNLHFEVETRLICLFDGAAVNVYIQAFHFYLNGYFEGCTSFKKFCH